MKMNWGTGIAIFYTFFVVTMVYMVIMSFQNKSDLVKEDYYQQDLGYEKHRQKIQNAKSLEHPLEVNYNEATGKIEMAFPENMVGISGEVQFFRASNKYLDQRHPLKVDHKNRMSLELTKKLIRGKWKIMIDWKSSDLSYYFEDDIII